MIHIPTLQPPIVILGMPQSGTSFLARILHEQGVPMCGSAGFHDDKHHECKELHDAITYELHFNPPAIRYPKTGDKATDRYLNAIRVPLRDEFRRAMVAYRRGREVAANGQQWGCKDPRLALMFEAAFGCFQGARFILCSRGPGDAASAAYWKGLAESDVSRRITYCTVYRNIWEYAQPTQQAMFEWSYNPRAGHYVQEAALSHWLGREVKYSDQWQEAKWWRAETGGGNEGSMAE